MQQIDVWYAIPEWEGYYEMNDELEIRHCSTKRLKKITTASIGYSVVQLWRNNKGKVCYLHDLVMATFIGPKPEGLCVNHIDGDKTNYKLSNLEYVTQKENIKHAFDTGLTSIFGENNWCSKLTESQVLGIKERALNGERTKDLAEEFHVGSPIISQIKHGSRWKHLN